MRFKRKKKNRHITETELAVRDLFYRLERHPNPCIERVRELIYRLGTATAREKLQVITELNSIVQSFKWVRRVHPTSGGFRAILLAERGEASPQEHQAIGTLLNLVENPKELARLRRCEWCKTWMYGGRKFCDNNGVCKQRAFDAKPENRKKKNDYMRNYYAENFASLREVPKGKRGR